MLVIFLLVKIYRYIIYIGLRLGERDGIILRFLSSVCSGVGNCATACGAIMRSEANRRYIWSFSDSAVGVRRIIPFVVILREIESTPEILIGLGFHKINTIYIYRCAMIENHRLPPFRWQYSRSTRYSILYMTDFAILLTLFATFGYKVTTFFRIMQINLQKSRICSWKLA